ncbi:Uncharacterised protein [Bordetella pertussis]|nr:Uncharacterised protein [Bordetella pertussis]CFW49356.1 Uncharacterised protein [Bordetella pertussis]
MPSTCRCAGVSASRSGSERSRTDWACWFHSASGVRMKPSCTACTPGYSDEPPVCTYSRAWTCAVGASMRCMPRGRAPVQPGGTMA